MAKSRAESFAGPERTEGAIPMGPAHSTGGFSPMRGRASGRPSPRVPLRQPAREATLAAHGLMESGTADPNQGQLFSTKQFERPVADVAKEAGVAPPLASSAGGFLPGIGPSETGKVSAHERKVNAIKAFAKTRAENPIDVPHLTPEGAERGQGARHMEHIQKLGEAAPESPWYTGRDEAGVVTEGHAIEGIRTVAAQTNSSMASMTRATAQTSPRTPWTAGNPVHPSMPNLETATNVGRAVRERESRFPGVKAREATLERLGRESGGVGLPLSKERAAISLGRPETASEPLPAGEKYAKVPNFNENLSVGQEQVPTPVRAAYAGAYTSDVHDLAAKNLPETLHQTGGQYDVDKQYSTRVAFKNRVMPGALQSGIWSKQRGVSDPEPLTGSLLREDQFTGKLTPSFDFSRNREGSVSDRRSETAKRMNIDF